MYIKNELSSAEKRALAHHFPSAADDKAAGRGGRDAAAAQIVGRVGTRVGSGARRGGDCVGQGRGEREAHGRRRGRGGAVRRAGVDHQRVGAGCWHAQRVAIGRRGIFCGIDGRNEAVAVIAQFEAAEGEGRGGRAGGEVHAERTAERESERAREEVHSGVAVGGRNEGGRHGIGGDPFVRRPRIGQRVGIDGGTVHGGGTGRRGRGSEEG